MMFHFELMEIDADGRERAKMHSPHAWQLSGVKERWQEFGRGSRVLE